MDSRSRRESDGVRGNGKGQQERSRAVTARRRDRVVERDPDKVSEGVNRIVEQPGEDARGRFVDAAARRIIECVEW